MQHQTRDRLVAAAFRLFARQGFGATTVDQIAAEAGVGRTTFFRYFSGKESVVFPDHGPILEAVDARLSSASRATSDVALLEASAIVLERYIAEANVARARYELTRSVPALRAAEIASQHRYQRLFRDHARTWGLDDLDAELLANGVVTAHNYVLRRWLRGLAEDPRAELGDALQRLEQSPDCRGQEAQAIIIPVRGDISAALERIRAALASDSPGTGMEPGRRTAHTG